MAVVCFLADIIDINRNVDSRDAKLAWLELDDSIPTIEPDPGLGALQA